jgi:hypothetical protein
MRFMPEDIAADLEAVNAWLADVQADVVPAYTAILREPAPEDADYFAGWDPLPWVLAQVESSSGPDPQRRPVQAGDWIYLVPNLAESTVYAMDDDTFHQTYVLA